MKINWNNKYATIAMYAFLVICGSILLYLGIARFTEIKSGINDFIGTLQPFIIGTALAYLLNFILKFYEKNILSYKWFNNLNKTAKRAVGIVFTYITAILITYLFIQFVLPQLIDSVVGLVNNIPQYVNDVSKYTADKVALAIAKGIDNNIITTNNKEVKEEMNYSMYLFSKNWYLKRYTDIASNATYKENPYKHYADYGKKEGRLALPPIPEEYCEGDYLDLNPDIVAAVKKGTFVSGIDHYLQNGFCENRKVCKDDNLDIIKKRCETLEVKLEEIKKIID